MPSVLTKPLARGDLLDIWDYVAADSLAKADRLLNTINKQCEKLARFPEMGRARDELAPSLRSFPVGKYVIFYRPIEDGVEVVRVLHGKREIREATF
ncbi:MAG: type II toxin-antitoxin system RelE/ParE family toxin [Blastocatellia bacterium]|nr:type II toxin-antitoxin system RelE/ParE family toxin [Blastocatellia bacterium]